MYFNEKDKLNISDRLSELIDILETYSQTINILKKQGPSNLGRRIPKKAFKNLSDLDEHIGYIQSWIFPVIVQLKDYRFFIDESERVTEQKRR